MSPLYLWKAWPYYPEKAMNVQEFRRRNMMLARVVEVEQIQIDTGPS